MFYAQFFFCCGVFVGVIVLLQFVDTALAMWINKGKGRKRDIY
jgi:hypothetical protein